MAKNKIKFSEDKKYHKWRRIGFYCLYAAIALAVVCIVLGAGVWHGQQAVPVFRLCGNRAGHLVLSHQLLQVALPELPQNAAAARTGAGVPCLQA